MVFLSFLVVTTIQFPSFLTFWTVLLGRVPGWHGFKVEENWSIYNSRCLIEIECASTLPCIILINSHFFGVHITSIKPPPHLLQHILNSRHTTSTIPTSDFLILRRNIGPTPICFATIVTPVEVLFAVVVPFSTIVPLLVVITLVLTFISLNLALNFPNCRLASSARNPPSTHSLHKNLPHSSTHQSVFVV